MRVMLRFQAVSSSDIPTSTHSTLLEHRSLVRVRGQDAAAFLQGLVTADVSNLDEQQSQYSMLLNPQVSVLAYSFCVYVHANASNQRMLSYLWPSTQTQNMGIQGLNVGLCVPMCHKSGNFRCKNIFVVDGGYEN